MEKTTYYEPRLTGNGADVKDMETRESRIDQLASVAIRVGVNLAEGQELVMTAPISALPLTRRIVEKAYEAGAGLVTTLFTDEEATLARFRHGHDQGFDRAATWLESGVASAYRSGAARLAVTGGNPALLSGQDPKKVSRANLALSKAMRPALDLITRHEINWSIVPCATPSWASAMFPELAQETALQRLWDAIFSTTRVDVADPIGAWQQHSAKLEERVKFLNAKRFSALHFRGPGTDLHVGLADDHTWLGGSSTAKNGIVCLANIPTEEVFTAPHKDRVHGVASSTKPLSYQGTLIENIKVRFENGRIVEATASAGETVLKNLLAVDPGAAQLGEVALVPHSSPIATSGLLFLNTLFDENAASHVAVGQSYSSCVRNGDSLDPKELAAKGTNESLIHVDWMIGSNQVDVEGIYSNGRSEPVMHAGEWV